MKNYNSRTNRIINPIHYNHVQTAYLTLEDKIQIGKYEGKILKEILYSDLNYLKWAIRNGAIKIAASAAQIIREEVKKNKRQYTDEEKEKFNERDKLVRDELKTNKEHVYAKKPIYIFDNEKQLIKKCESKKDCAEEFKIHETTIRIAIKTKQIVKDKYYFSTSEYGFNIF